MDWIDQFMNYTSGIRSTEDFRLWTAISTIAGTVERRVVHMTDSGAVYPNLYVALVAPPGIGKGVVSYASKLWTACGRLYVSPDELTHAALIDELNESARTISDPVVGTPLNYRYLNIGLPEFGTLFKQYDDSFLTVFSKFWDAEPSHTERLRGRKKEEQKLVIPNPSVNFIAAVQPAYLAGHLPELAWTQGFMSRMLMVYCDATPKLRMYGTRHNRREELATQWQTLVAYLQRLLSVTGEMIWEEEAREAFEDWLAGECLPAPDHIRLHHYNSRRHQQILKLTMVSVLARSTTLIMTMADFERAKSWLFHIEKRMPEIFKAMLSHPDAQILEEFQSWVWMTYFGQNSKPLTGAQVRGFLSKCMPSEKVERMLELAVNSNRVNRLAGGQDFTPCAKGSELPA